MSYKYLIYLFFEAYENVECKNARIETTGNNSIVLYWPKSKMLVDSYSIKFYPFNETTNSTGFSTKLPELVHLWHIYGVENNKKLVSYF